LHQQRKRQHIDICLTRDVRSAVNTGIEHYRFVHQALPEIALSEVSTRVTFLGHSLEAPILVSAMTGGTDQAARVNRHLATAAQTLGLAMGLGSQRAGLEDPRLMSTYQVRDVAPDVLLLANLGAVQLNNGYGVDECRRAVDSVSADGLVLHLNALQEALQPDGNTNFSGLLNRIEQVCRSLEVPVIVKEVGWGIGARAARALIDAGVAALDVAGAGGTSWSQVERCRSISESDAATAAAFADWGIPTVEALLRVRAECPESVIIASGGIRNGVEAGICLALGADLVGTAHPVLEPATHSAQSVIDTISVLLRQLRTAMFCAGVRRVVDLAPHHVTRRSTIG